MTAINPSQSRIYFILLACSFHKLTKLRNDNPEVYWFVPSSHYQIAKSIIKAMSGRHGIRFTTETDGRYPPFPCLTSLYIAWEICVKSLHSFSSAKAKA